MENTTFYIKYRDFSPVGINTHVFNANTFQWVQVHFRVTDLIYAFKTATKPLLDKISLVSLNLYKSKLEADALEPDAALSELQSGRTAATALVIKVNETRKSSSLFGFVCYFLITLFERKCRSH